MKGDLEINGIDAYTQWGASLLEGALVALMTPAPLKAPIESKSRLLDGKVVEDAVVCVDERDITLQVKISAPNETVFATRYAGFVGELQKGNITLKTRWQPDVCYRLRYESCTQFAGFVTGRCLAKFTLKFNEPNPKDRAL